MSVSGISGSKDFLELNKDVLGTVDATVTSSKYHNAQTESHGMTFQSGHEASEIGKLVTLDKAHQGVFALRLQVRFPLPGKSAYVADAVYVDDALQVHIVDAKGFRTPEYRLKRKLFKEKYGREIEEV